MNITTQNPSTRILTVTDVSIKLEGGRELVNDFTLTINPSDVIGIIGEEGNGKSTLLAYIAGEPLPDSFVVHGARVEHAVTVGYLPQRLPQLWNQATVEQYLVRTAPETAVDFDRYEQWQFIQAQMNMFGLNPDAFLERTMEQLSGGEKVKIQLVKLLASRPDILCLDEPTNDVDIEFLQWFEHFVLTAQQGIVVISHDETLLEHVTNRIVHLEQVKRKQQCRHTIANVGYAEYVQKRFRQLEKQEQQARRDRRDQQRTLQMAYDIENKIKGAHDATKDAQAKRLLGKTHRRQKAYVNKALNRELTERVDVEEAIIFEFPSAAQVVSGKNIIDFYTAALTVPDDTTQVLSRNISLHISGPTHVTIIGTNGSGKTTLLRLLLEHIKNDQNISVGYFPQEYEEILTDQQCSAVDYLVQPQAGISESFARTNLGRMKFTPDEQVAPIATLSGGQKAKLVLVQLLLSGAKVLVLDEPTRNISPLSNPVIRSALAAFPGAIIAVSHDRKYIEQVSDVVYQLSSQGLHQVQLD